MISLIKGIRDDAAAIPEPRTRQWRPAFTPDALESQESTRAPGYDENGEPLPAPLIDEEGNLHIPGGAVIDGDVTVRGSLQGESEPTKN